MGQMFGSGWVVWDLKSLYVFNCLKEANALRQSNTAGNPLSFTWKSIYSTMGDFPLPCEKRPEGILVFKHVHHLVWMHGSAWPTLQLQERLKDAMCQWVASIMLQEEHADDHEEVHVKHQQTLGQFGYNSPKAISKIKFFHWAVQLAEPCSFVAPGTVKSAAEDRRSRALLPGMAAGGNYYERISRCMAQILCHPGCIGTPFWAHLPKPMTLGIYRPSTPLWCVVPQTARPDVVGLQSVEVSWTFIT